MKKLLLILGLVATMPVAPMAWSQAYYGARYYRPRSPAGFRWYRPPVTYHCYRGYYVRCIHYGGHGYCEPVFVRPYYRGWWDPYYSHPAYFDSGWNGYAPGRIRVLW